MNSRQSEIAGEPLETQLAALGPLRAAFGPSKLNLWAGIIAGLLFTGLGIASFVITIWPIHGPRKESLGEAVVAAIVLLLMFWALSAFIFWTVWSLSKVRVAVCDFGFFHQDGATTVVFHYDQIWRVEEDILRRHAPIMVPPFNLLFPKITSRSFDIYRRDGRHFGFNRNDVWEMNRLVDMLKPECLARGIPWNVTERG